MLRIPKPSRLLALLALASWASASAAERQSLLSGISASREQYGGVLITAHAALPDGTEVMLDLLPGSGKKVLGQAKVKVAQSSLTAGPFTNLRKPWASGPYRVRFFSRFNKGWQSAAVLQLTGEGGSKLPRAALKPEDPDLPASAQTAFELNETVPIEFDPQQIQTKTAEEAHAVARVRAAKLTVPDQGKSADSIGNVVKYFASAGSFASNSVPAWSASKREGLWIVALTYADRSAPEAPRKAEWSLDPKNGQVKYLDKNAKDLSWTPRY